MLPGRISQNTPTFSQAACLSYFKSSCDSSNQSYCGLPDWVSEVMPCPDIEMEFDTSAITPGQVKRTLNKCSSSPGADQITYFHLRNLPSIHNFLATPFTKILLEAQRPLIMILSRNHSDTQRWRPIQSEEFPSNCNVFWYPQALAQNSAKTPRILFAKGWNNQP